MMKEDHRMSIEMIVKAVVGSLSQFSWRDFIDIGLITVLIYKLTILTKGTRAYQVLKGVAIFFLVTVFCKLFDLSTVNWLLSSVLVSGIIIVVVLFQPELRRAYRPRNESRQRNGRIHLISVRCKRDTQGSIEPCKAPCRRAHCYRTKDGIR